MVALDDRLQRKRNPFSCLLFGTGSLPIVCAQLLLQNGNTIVAVVTSDASVEAWARTSGLTCHRPGADLCERLGRVEVDYLFSIVTSAVLPDAVLRIPRYSAINFHNSPLPKYAGLNATSWALINQEREHGVSWHLMSDVIDAGDLLDQESVAILPGDTALSLNVRCHDAATVSFARLIEAIAAGEAVARRQELANRTYFGRAAVLPGAGILAFEQPAAALEAMVRATQFGHVPNPLGTAKLIADNRVLVVTRASALVVDDDTAPGTVIHSGPDGIVVACRPGQLRLAALETLEGESLPIERVSKQIEVGSVLQLGTAMGHVELVALEATRAKDEAFWLRRLRAFAPTPFPLCDGATRGRELERWSGGITVELVALRALSDAAAIDPSHLVAAGHLAVLGRRGASETLALGYRGAEIARRHRSDGFGLGVALVPFEIEWRSNESFVEFARRVSNEIAALEARGDYRADLIARCPELRRERSRANGEYPFVLEIGDHTDLRPLAARPIVLRVGTDGTRVEWTHDPDVVSRASLERLHSAIRTFIAAIIEAPSSALRDIPMLARSEQTHILEVVVDGGHAPALDRHVHQLFEDQVARSPDAPAVQLGDQSVTYVELDRRANRLARLLVDLGVGPETVVGVWLDRSAELVVSLLAVLKAGGAYLPLDLAYPHERLRFMATDANAKVVVTRASIMAAGSPAWPDVQIVAIDAIADELGTRSAENLGRGVDGSHLAYVIYTSGSTGRPKGVMIEHRGLTNYLAHCLRAYPVERGIGTPVHSSISFDLTVTSIFPSLLVGRALFLVPDELGVEGLVSLLREHQPMSLVKLTPSHLELLSQALCAEEAAGASNCLVVGGEQLLESHVRFFRRHAPGMMIVNEYGPTETVVGCAIHVAGFEAGIIPIGRPIANMRLYVLDAELSLVPLGMVGELHIAGVGVARGYLGRADLSAERFLPDPYGPPGSRCYRTGDLARYRPDGVLEFLGRRDDQVKVRGHRLELGEIEAVLQAHAQVRSAVVITSEDRPGATILVAYVCLSGLATIDELRGFVAERLPAYMVPSVFMVLDELPLTTSGKIDRKRLPAPLDEDFQRAEYAAPRTEAETVLAAIWRDVLGIERVSIYDNFFALGGNSLLVMRLVARISGEVGVELPFRSAFDSPTIAELARRVEAEVRADPTIADTAADRELAELVAALSETEVTAQLAEWSSVMLEPLPTRSSELTSARRELLGKLMAQHRIDSRPGQPLARRTSPSARATFAQQLQWDFHQRGNYPALSNRATAFAVRGRLNISALQQAIAALVERQAALRTTFAEQRGHLIQTVQDRGPTLDIIDLHAFSDREERARQLFEAISRPHDLHEEVFRAQLVRFDDGFHVLLLAPHHIVVDGFSWNVLDANLAALYRALAAGKEPTLAPLGLQNTEFCFWQTTLEARPIGRKQLEFWARAVAGYEGLELSGDGRAVARGTVGMALDTYPKGAAPFVLEGAAWNAVERLCSRLSCTPYTVIATGFLLLLTRWSGRNDACILSSGFHRNRPGSEAVIGNFVTPYPLRVLLADEGTLEQTVRRCHEAVLLHREHGHVAPSSALATRPEWSRYNLNYQIELASEAVDFGSVTVERLDWSALAQRTAQDLALHVQQGLRGIRGHLVYNAERFSAEMAAKAAVRLGQLIETITTAPSARVSALPRAP